MFRKDRRTGYILEDESKIFLVRWQTGGIRVNIANFFGNASKTDINKLLKLAKVHCTREQHAKLLQDLKEALQERTEAGNDPRGMAGHCKHLEWCIKKIEGMTWR